MMATAKNFIGHFRTCGNITNNNLFTFDNHDATYCSSIMGCSCAAPAESFNL
jgi:hypothetical protein